MTAADGRSRSGIEEEIFLAAAPQIRKLCARKWLNMEPEDRVAEASLFFIRALRSLPHDTGRFMKDYIEQLIPYMDQKNRECPSRLYGALSLDEMHPSADGSGAWCRYDAVIGPRTDESAEEVALFLRSLSGRRRMIMQDLLRGGLAKAAIARKYGLTPYMLKQTLQRIWQDYQSGAWR